jgi:hypothetical protein
MYEHDKQSFKLVHEFDVPEQNLEQSVFKREQILEAIVFQIITEPKALSVHLQRIYFCYRENLAEDLFAALIDLLIILQGKGRDLSQRMVRGAKSKLIAADYAILKQGLSFSEAQISLLNGNKYSVFSTGLIGTNVLIVKTHALEQPVHDPIDIARDFIAYSQLDAAIETLENAILLDVQRQVLHDDLLELYKVTHNVERFTKMYATLSKQMTAIPAGWDELKGFFNEG